MRTDAELVRDGLSLRPDIKSLSNASHVSVRQLKRALDGGLLTVVARRELERLESVKPRSKR